MSAVAIGFVAGACASGGGDGPLHSAFGAPAGLCRAQGGAVDVLHLPRDASGAPRDRLRAALAAHRAADAFLPLPPGRETSLEAALEIARTRPTALRSRLRLLAGACEIDLRWEACVDAGRPGCEFWPPAHGGSWLRARAARIEATGRRAAALRSLAESAGVRTLACDAGPGWARAVFLAFQAQAGTLRAALAAVPRDPALAGGRLLVTGPWPVFSAASCESGDSW